MQTLTEILLCNLKFWHQRSLRYLVENWIIRCARLKIQRSVVRLQYHILTKLPIKRLKLIYGLHDSVFSLMITIYETTPHYDTTIWQQCIRQHVCPIGMRPMIVTWTWLSFRIGLHQISSEIRYYLINLIRFFMPPF